MLKLIVNCWKGYCQINEVKHQVWENADAIVWSWKPRNPQPYKRIKIPEKEAQKAKSCFGLACEDEPQIDKASFNVE